MPCQNCALRLFCAAELDFQSCTPELLHGPWGLLVSGITRDTASVDISRFPKKAQLSAVPVAGFLEVLGIAFLLSGLLLVGFTQKSFAQKRFRLERATLRRFARTAKAKELL